MINHIYSNINWHPISAPIRPVQNRQSRHNPEKQFSLVSGEWIEAESPLYSERHDSDTCFSYHSPHIYNFIIYDYLCKLDNHAPETTSKSSACACHNQSISPCQATFTMISPNTSFELSTRKKFKTLYICTIPWLQQISHLKFMSLRHCNIVYVGVYI